MRSPISKQTRDEVIGFYGRECVVLGGEVEGTLHHLNGDHSKTIFENLIPLGHTLHSRLRRPTKRQATGSLNQTDTSLDPQRLRERAIELYRHGETARAFGCARLAYAMRRYYRQRDIQDELESLVDALYYLRRCLILHPALGYRALRHLLDSEILPAISKHPVLSSKTVLLMVEEMAAWLNEFGASESALPIFRVVDELTQKFGVSKLGAALRSGLLRQKSFGLIHSGQREDEETPS